MKARAIASASRCMSSAEPNGGRGENPSMMLRIIPIVMPPELAGGIE